jgi:hypothetical protein
MSISIADKGLPEGNPLPIHTRLLTKHEMVANKRMIVASQQ